MIRDMPKLNKSPELTVPFGLKDGALHFVSDVPSGSRCGCICPQCRAPLVARNRPSPDRRRVFHFQHASTSACVGGRESAIHRMAKEILARAPTLLLPEWRSGEIAIPALALVVQGTPAMEVPLLEGRLRPDVLVNGECAGTTLASLLVEIRVCHAVDGAKRALTKENRLSMIEIDLSDVTDEQLLDSEAFHRLVLEETGNRKWIHLADAAFMVVATKHAVIEIIDAELRERTLRSKAGNLFVVVEQAAVLHKPTSRGQCIIQVPDGTVGEAVQAYAPGLYILSDRSYTVDRWGHLALRFKLYLDEIEMNPDTAAGPEQSALFADHELVFGPTFRARSRRWSGH
jgi:hypothetical protein